MSKRIQNDELDWLIWLSLRDSDVHPFSDPNLIPPGGDWGGSKAARIDCRLQAMRHDGRIRFHRHGSPRPAHVRAHGWEVLGCPGAGVQEDGQFDWAYGCGDCQRRLRPDPADGAIKPPSVVAFECELRIEPLQITP